MKILKIGKSLSKAEQKNVNGGRPDKWYACSTGGCYPTAAVCKANCPGAPCYLTLCGY